MIKCYLAIKAKEVIFDVEVTWSDSLGRFACADVFFLITEYMMGHHWFILKRALGIKKRIRLLITPKENHWGQTTRVALLQKSWSQWKQLSRNVRTPVTEDERELGLQSWQSYGVPIAPSQCRDFKSETLLKSASPCEAPAQRDCGRFEARSAFGNCLGRRLRPVSHPGDLSYRASDLSCSPVTCHVHVWHVMYLYEMSSSDFTCYVPLSGLRCLSDLCLTHDSQSAGDITITFQITMMTRELFAGSQIDDCWRVSLFPPLFIPPMNTQRQMLKHQHNHEDIDDEKRLSKYT